MATDVDREVAEAWRVANNAQRREQSARERLAGKRVRQCGCGVCGLTFPPTPGRRFHPQCPNRARPTKGKRLMLDPRRPKRCPRCEGMPHVRPPKGCPVCRQPYAPERIRRPEALHGCPLGGL